MLKINDRLTARSPLRPSSSAEYSNSMPWLSVFRNNFRFSNERRAIYAKFFWEWETSTALRIALQHCPHCDQSEIYTSRPADAWEKFAVLLLLRPVRCRSCIARFYRPLWIATPVHPRRLASWIKHGRSKDQKESA
jgi:hypothetical protein